MQEFFLNVARLLPTTLLKRGSGTSIFKWILRYFSEQLIFHNTSRRLLLGIVAPIDTRRRFNVDATSYDVVRHRIDVETKWCVYWDKGFFYKKPNLRKISQDSFSIKKRKTNRRRTTENLENVPRKIIGILFRYILSSFKLKSFKVSKVHREF